MSSSLLLQQCPVCLVRLILLVFMMGGRWPYSCCFVGCCLPDLQWRILNKSWRYTYIYIYIIFYIKEKEKSLLWYHYKFISGLRWPIIIIIIMSCRQQGYPSPSLATSPYRSSRPVGLQGYISYPHIAAECMFELVVLLLPGHMWRSIGAHHLWARPWFSSSFLHVWFV